MEEQTKKDQRKIRLNVTRLFNSLIVNMTKCEDILVKLDCAISDEEAKNRKDDRCQAVSYIDRQIGILLRFKEANFSVEEKTEPKQKKAA